MRHFIFPAPSIRAQPTDTRPVGFQPSRYHFTVPCLRLSAVCLMSNYDPVSHAKGLHSFDIGVSGGSGDVTLKAVALVLEVMRVREVEVAREEERAVEPRGTVHERMAEADVAAPVGRVAQVAEEQRLGQPPPLDR